MVMANAMYGAESGAAIGPGDVPSDRYLEIRVAARSNRDVAFGSPPEELRMSKLSPLYTS
jgi:hypothetical protein